MPGIRGGRRALSEVLGALFASIAILSAAATLITLSGQAEKNLREALSQEPPLIRVARLENGSILVYNPSPRGVRIDGIVLRNGSLVQTPRKVVAPGATLLLNASDAAALVAGGRIYAIPNLTDSYPPTLEPPGRCNNPLTTWATVGLGHLITYYHINTSILCNPHITNLSKTRFTISITK
nr:hypothetical protein [Desulfurococcales archaeon]